MQVIIKEKEYEYQSDYNDGWQFSSGDDFKFPVRIGQYPCFIKRFARNPERVTGWRLLEAIRGTNQPGLPRIHDIVQTEERGEKVRYLFYECLEGNTLDNVIRDGAVPDMFRLTNDIFKALGSMHRHEHWMADFCEKNIFCTKGGGFLLIDLDSAYRSGARPDNQMYGSKDYWALAFSYLKEQVGLNGFHPADISGPVLNYLQAVFLILRVRAGLVDRMVDYKSQAIAEKLPGWLESTVPEYRELLGDLVRKGVSMPDETDVDEIKKLLIGRVVNGQPEYREEGKTQEKEEKQRWDDGRTRGNDGRGDDGRDIRVNDGRKVPVDDKKTKKEEKPKGWGIDPIPLKTVIKAALGLVALLLLVLLGVKGVQAWIRHGKDVPVKIDSIRRPVMPPVVQVIDSLKKKEDSITEIRRRIAEEAEQVKPKSNTEGNKKTSKSSKLAPADPVPPIAKPKDTAKAVVIDEATIQQERRVARSVLMNKAKDSVRIVDTLIDKKVLGVINKGVRKLGIWNYSSHFLDTVVVEITMGIGAKPYRRDFFNIKANSFEVVMDKLPKNQAVMATLLKVEF